MHSDEGEAKDVSLMMTVPESRPHSNRNMRAGLLCQNQSLDYDFSILHSKYFILNTSLEILHPILLLRQLVILHIRLFCYMLSLLLYISLLLLLLR